jgi:uncharacterized protein (TIGR02996 family)
MAVELSELVELVAENPDAVDPFLVYADYLQEKGDPRGELITLELMRLADPHDEDRIRAVARHLDRHHHELLGPLVVLSACLSDEKWRLGFLQRVTLRHPDAASPDEVARWLELLLDAPASAFLRELTLTPLLTGDYTPLIRTLAERSRSLRLLRIGPGHAFTRINLGSSPGLTRLKSLALAATRIDLATVRLEGLEELDLWVEDLTRANLRSLTLSELPSLRSLAIAFNRGRITDLPRLLLGPMPKLEHLRINARASAQLAGFVAELARSDVAPQLASLRIDGAGVDDIERLADSSDAFPSLTKLTIGAREYEEDLLDRFRDRGVEVRLRCWMHFNPWDEDTEVEVKPYDRYVLVVDPSQESVTVEWEDGTIYAGYRR